MMRLLKVVTLAAVAALLLTVCTIYGASWYYTSQHG